MELVKKISFFFFVVFILILFVWALFTPKTDISSKIASAIKSQTGKSDLFFTGVVFQEIDDGEKYWEIKAKTSDMNKTKKQAILKEAAGTFFTNGKPSLKFVSPEILWRMDKKEISMKTPFGYDAGQNQPSIKEKKKNFFLLPGSGGRGYYFKAQELKWNMEDKRISCRGDIWIKKDDLNGSGQNLKSDVNLKRVILTGDPNITIGRQELTTVEAEYFEVLNETNQVIANGNVSIQFRDMKARGERAVYNIALREILLSGKVKLEQGESVLTGDRIVYTVNDNKFKISGRSKAIIPENKLEEIQNDHP